MSKVAGDFEHLADEIRLGDLQSLGKDLKLLHTGKGALDMDAKTSDVGAVLALLLGEVRTLDMDTRPTLFLTSQNVCQLPQWVSGPAK